MANTMKTKIRLPISTNSLETIKKEFQDISVEKDGVYAITRGFLLHNLLKALSQKSKEIIIAEHSSSADMYSTLYIEQYKDGKSETIETKTEYIIFYDAIATNVMSNEVIRQIREKLEDYVEFQEIEFIYEPADSKYDFKVKKKGDFIEVEVIGEIDDPYDCFDDM